MPPGPGFGDKPRSFHLKVTIVGHASPRWKSAKNVVEADRQNEVLAERRSLTVRNAVELMLKQRFGESIPIEYDLSYATGGKPRFAAIGTSSVGSRVSLERAKGNRNNNEKTNRGVEVAVELITTEYVSAGRSVPLGRISAFTRFWYVTIKSLLVTGIVVPGPAAAFLTLEIKNSLSKKTALYRATLAGGGDPMPSDTASKVGRSDAPIVTDTKIGFDEFDGEWVRLYRMDLQLGIGVSRYYISFPGLGEDAYNYMGQEFGVGLPGGFIVAGTLKMASKNPGDWFDSDFVYDESDIVEVDGRTVEALFLPFPTGSADLPLTERRRLEQFVDVWERRLR